MGAALNLYLAAVDRNGRVNFVGHALVGMVLMFVGFGAKEPMVACGVGFGLSFLLLGQMDIQVRSKALILGSTLLGVAVLYGLAIKLFVQSGYSSSYSFTNFPKMLGNLVAWLRKDVFNHSPWLVIILVLGLAAIRTGGAAHLVSQFNIRRRWGMIFGTVLYGGYLLFLLPWNTTAYYAGPLGVFFAMPVSILVAVVWSESRISVQVLIPVASLLFNMLVSQWALTRESLYHYDTQNLMTWVRGNPEFQLAADGGLVYCNAMEGGGAIPAHLERDFGVLIPGFTYKGFDQNSFRAGQIMVYTPRFGSDTDTFSPDLWETQFYSKFWQVYVHK